MKDSKLIDAHVIELRAPGSLADCVSVRGGNSRRYVSDDIRPLRP
jgi:hypothetical protein